MPPKSKLITDYLIKKPVKEIKYFPIFNIRKPKINPVPDPGAGPSGSEVQQIGRAQPVSIQNSASGNIKEERSD